MPKPPSQRRRANRTGRDADPKRTLKLNGAKWQKLRAEVLADEPLCRHCAARGLVVPATDVDHMNGADDNRRESLQPLCHPCHSRKTARDHGRNVAYGCDASGHPADPMHPWNQGAVGGSGGATDAIYSKSPATATPRPPCPPNFYPKSKKTV